MDQEEIDAGSFKSLLKEREAQGDVDRNTPHRDDEEVHDVEALNILHAGLHDYGLSMMKIADLVSKLDWLGVEFKYRKPGT